MVGLYLMNKKGLITLEYLLQKNAKDLISFVVGAKDKDVQNDYFTEIKELCSENNLVHYEKEMKICLEVNYKIAIGWRWIIPDFENLIVLHDSLLPRYRGFAPLVNSLINGEKEIGVTTLFADKEYDKGNVISQKSIHIEYPIKIEEAINKVSELYGELVYELFQKLKSNQSLYGIAQNEEKATYSVWLDKEDYFIDWTWNAEKIKRKIDATGFPYLGAKTTLDGELITIIACNVMDDLNIENRTPGKIFGYSNKKSIVICGSGLLILNGMVNEKGDSFSPKSLRKRFK